MEMTVKKVSKLHTDEVLRLLGQFNKYQKIIYILLGLVVFRGSFSVLGIILIGRDPGHVCNPQVLDNNHNNISINLTSIKGGGEGGGDYVIKETTSQCYYTKSSNIISTLNGYQNETLPCRGPWKYNQSFTSIVTQWNLVCDRSYLVDLSSTIYMIGCAFGCVFLMPLGDTFGRRPILLINLVFMVLLNIGLAFSNSVIIFILLRFIIGALNMSITLLVYCMIAEFLPSTHRTLPVIGASFFWSLGIMFLAFVGYFIKDWKILQIVISLPNFIVIILWWFLPESPMWLFLKEKYQETLDIIQCAAKWNNSTTDQALFTNKSPNILSSDVSSLNEESCLNFDHSKNSLSTDDYLIPTKNRTSDTKDHLKLDETNPYDHPQQETKLMPLKADNIETFQSTNSISSSNNELKFSQEANILAEDFAATESIRSLFSTPKMLMYTLITFYLLLVISLSYFGILFNTPSLPGNIYMNLFFSAIVEIVANIIVIIFINRMGRRKPIACFLLICGVSNLVSLGISYSETDYKMILMLIWTMTGKFGISGSYSLVYLLLAEIFPTTVRNQAMGSASLFENLGSILAPLVMLWAKNDGTFPLSIFGVLTVIGGLLVLLLPETHLKPLPNNVKQIESW